MSVTITRMKKTRLSSTYMSFAGKGSFGCPFFGGVEWTVKLQVGLGKYGCGILSIGLT